MTRCQKEPLRAVTDEERAWLTQISRTQRESASQVARATILLAVADGQSYTKAAQQTGRRSGDAVAHLVARFNQEGLSAVERGRGSGAPPDYGTKDRERILAEARRAPDRERDGTATWSMTTLPRAVRAAPDGLPSVSTDTIWRLLRGAGWTWQRSRTWCETGMVRRQRKAGTVTVIDPDTTAKKN